MDVTAGEEEESNYYVMVATPPRSSFPDGRHRKAAVLIEQGLDGVLDRVRDASQLARAEPTQMMTVTMSMTSTSIVSVVEIHRAGDRAGRVAQELRCFMQLGR